MKSLENLQDELEELEGRFRKLADLWHKIDQDENRDMYIAELSKIQFKCMILHQDMKAARRKIVEHHHKAKGLILGLSRREYTDDD